MAREGRKSDRRCPCCTGCTRCKFQDESSTVEGYRGILSETRREERRRNGGDRVKSNLDGVGVRRSEREERAGVVDEGPDEVTCEEDRVSAVGIERRGQRETVP